MGLVASSKWCGSSELMAVEVRDLIHDSVSKRKMANTFVQRRTVVFAIF